MTQRVGDDKVLARVIQKLAEMRKRTKPSSPKKISIKQKMNKMRRELRAAEIQQQSWRKVNPCYETFVNPAILLNR